MQKYTISDVDGMIKILDNSQPANIPLNFAKDIDLVRATLLRESIYKRINELANSAYDACSKERKVSAILLARGLMETGAFFSYFLGKLKVAVESNQFNDLKEFLTSALLGARSPLAVEKFKRPQAIHVLKCIDQVDKNTPQYRAQYDFLSEFSHPNSAGLNLMYCKIDHEKAEAVFNSTSETITIDFIITQVGISLECFIYEYNVSASLLDQWLKRINEKSI